MIEKWIRKQHKRHNTQDVGVVLEFNLKSNVCEKLFKKYKSLNTMKNDKALKYHNTLETREYCAWRLVRIYTIKEEFVFKKTKGGCLWQKG